MPRIDEVHDKVDDVVRVDPVHVLVDAEVPNYTVNIVVIYPETN